jgi:hypothetical protein
MNDMAAPLPESGGERQIFIEALRTYRDSCQPPELTPGCPFFTWTANGPACGEECADLLARHGDEVSEEPIYLGDGIAIVRHTVIRRPRRGPTATDRPFDARRIYLDDEHRAHADRRTAALIFELGSLICLPPSHWTDPDERSYDIQAVKAQLDSRGFDVDALIRYGVGTTLPMSIIAYVLLPMLREDELLRPMIEATPGPAVDSDGAWQKYFDEAYLADNHNNDQGRYEKLHYTIHGFIDRIRVWLRYADIDSILMWSVPQLEAYTCQDGEPERSSTDRATKALWAMERFTQCYAADWSLSSLHLEWLYLHGHLPAPCSTTAMAERRIDSADISAAIAAETSDMWRKRTSEKTDSRAGDFVAVAAGHLRNGKSELAAAIFEAVTSVHPDDGEALNNYGFCLLGFDPSSALEVLERANRISECSNLITLANRVLALHLLGRNDDAYALGISEEARTLPSTPALMWLVDADDRLELSDWMEAREYLTTLIVHIDRGCCSGGLNASPVAIS